MENEYEGELPLHLQGLDPQVFANLVLNKIHITRPVTKKLHVKTKSEIDQKKKLAKNFI